MINEALRGECSRLMPLVAAGDRDAFAQLYDATAPTVLAIIRHRTSPDQINDLAVGIYGHVWADALHRDPTRDALSWLLTLTLRHTQPAHTAQSAALN